MQTNRKYQQPEISILQFQRGSRSTRLPANQVAKDLVKYHTAQNTFARTGTTSVPKIWDIKVIHGTHFPKQQWFRVSCGFRSMSFSQDIVLPNDIAYRPVAFLQYTFCNESLQPLLGLIVGDIQFRSNFHGFKVLQGRGELAIVSFDKVTRRG